MKMKLLVPALGLLLLAGCSEDENPPVAPTPAPQNLCFLQEETSTSPNGESTIRFTYNDLNQVIGTEHYEQDELKAIRTYTYTTGGKLAEEHLFKPDGQEEVSFTVYSYNPQGQVSKYEVKQVVPGLETVHRISLFKAVYDLRGRLTSATDYLYLDNKERSNGSVTLTYVQGKTTATVKNTEGQTAYTATFKQDSSRAPLSAVPVYLNRRPGIGYPNLVNITSLTATDPDKQQVASVSYTKKYTLNKQGYPVSAIITYNDGREEKLTYTYDCTE